MRKRNPDFPDLARQAGTARQHAFDRRRHEEVIVRSVDHRTPSNPVRDVYTRADLRVVNDERVPIDAEPQVAGQTTAKLDIVLRERAHLAAAVATVERDALVRDVNVR